MRVKLALMQLVMITIFVLFQVIFTLDSFIYKYSTSLENSIGVSRNTVSVGSSEITMYHPDYFTYILKNHQEFVNATIALAS